MERDGSRWLTLWSDTRPEHEVSILGWLDGLRRLGFECRVRERSGAGLRLLLLQVQVPGSSLEHELRQIQQAAAAVGEGQASDVKFLVRRLWPEVTLWSGPRDQADEISAALPKGVEWSVGIGTVGRIQVSWRHFDRARSALAADPSEQTGLEWLTPYANGEIAGTWPSAGEITAVAAGLESRGLRTRVTTTGSAEARMPVLLVGSDAEDLEAFVTRVSSATAGVEEEWACQVSAWVARLIPTVVVHCAGATECRRLFREFRDREPELRWGVSWHPETDAGELYAGIGDVERALETIDRTLGT